MNNMKEKIKEIRELYNTYKTNAEGVLKLLDAYDEYMNDPKEFNQLLEQPPFDFDFDYKSIKTIEDAYKRNGKDFGKVVSTEKHIQAYIDLCEIVKAINNDPDIDNYEKHWHPYFRIRARSWYHANAYGGFSYLDAFYASSNKGTFFGSRLAFDSKEKAEYAAEQFKDLYRDFILGKE